MGVGITRTSGQTAGRLGDPAPIYLVWVGVGIFVLMVANTLAELATAIPKAGGPYVSVRRAFGAITPSPINEPRGPPAAAL